MNRQLLAVRGLAFAFAFAALSCSEDEAPGPSGISLRVLFMGNSLTYENDLPSMVKSIAEAEGIDIVTDVVAEANYALEDHWNFGSARTKVADGNFDVVIMQQGPSSLPESRTFLREWAAIWAPVIRASGAEPALYAVWPEAARAHVFGDVSESYRLAALDVNGYFLPVGDTWLETWRQQPEAPLYGPDDFHPSRAGTYAAAVVILAVLTNRDARSFSGVSAVGDALGERIRIAANTVITRFGNQARPR